MDQMARQVPGGGGCGRIAESSVRAMMARFGMSREEAGLAISVTAMTTSCNTLRECLLQPRSFFPMPGEPVSLSGIWKRAGGQSSHFCCTGLVTRGVDWSLSNDVDGWGGEEDEAFPVGYMSINGELAREHKCRVVWPLSKLPDKTSVHSIGGLLEKFDLVYAAYRYPE